MNLKGFFLLIYLLISISLFTLLEVNFLVFGSFFINATLLTLIVIYHLYYEKKTSPFLSSFIVFNFLFFLVAPIIQISSFNSLEATKFVNYFPFTKETTFYSNVLIAVFNIFFIIFYILFKKNKKLIEVNKIKHTQANYPLYILIVFIASIFIFIISYDFVIEDLATPSWMEYKASVVKLLGYKKVLFMLPFAGVIMSFHYLKSQKKINNNSIFVFIYLCAFILLLFWFKNPFTEKRNALGPIYLSLFFLFIPKLFSSNVKTLSFLFFIMIVLFPLSSILTHSDATFAEIINNPKLLLLEAKYGGISKTFNTLHYDAFANINATIGYVSKNGFSYGFQLLSAFLFFVPRSFWESKPVSTGQLIGEDLIDNYGFNFSNLSNPLVSEGYINFGLLGVIIFAVLFAYTLIFFIKWLNSNDILKKIMSFYLAIHLLFLLRGDFTNGFSYYVGTLFGVIVIPKILFLIVNEIVKLKDEV